MNITPSIKIAYNQNYVTATGKLEGFLFSSDDIAVLDGPKKYYLHLNVRLDSGVCLPKKISNISLIIKSKQLPMDSYSYQYCDKFSARNLPCSFSQYLKVAGTVQGDKGVHPENCRVFRLEKGSPHQYCSFLLGT